jgi:hypothetical protein
MKRVGEVYSEGYAMGRALERLASGSALRAVVRMRILQIFFAFRSDLNTPGHITVEVKRVRFSGFPEAFMKARFNE